MNISVIVPVFNEEGNVENLHREIKEVCEANNYIYEIIFVDDGSTDKTREKCLNLIPLKYIRLRRNSGQTAAMDAGIKAAKHEYIITMDGDGQNDPTDIPGMLNYLLENQLDVVSGWRKKRNDTVAKRFISRGANFLRYLLVHDGIHDSGCSLKVYRKECFEKINLYGEQHRFIPALLKIKGYEIGEYIVNHRARISGKTKYNWRRTYKGFLDMLSVCFWNKYATRPLHLLGGGGLIFFIIGLVCGIWSIVLFLLGYEMKRNLFPPLMTVFFITVGLLLIVFGLMSEILIKIYFGANIDAPYDVKEVRENI